MKGTTGKSHPRKERRIIWITLTAAQIMINDLNSSSLCHHGYGQDEQCSGAAALVVNKGEPHLVGLKTNISVYIYIYILFWGFFSPCKVQQQFALQLESTETRAGTKERAVLR